MFQGRTINELTESVRLAEYRAAGNVFHFALPNREVAQTGDVQVGSKSPATKDSK